jgi:hypothetical protein
VAGAYVPKVVVAGLDRKVKRKGDLYLETESGRMECLSPVFRETTRVLGKTE